MTLKYLTGTIVTAALCTAGCSLTTEQPPEPGPDAITSVVIVAGTHANSPRPQLSEDSAAVVRSVLAVNGTVGVVAVTGSPAPLSADELKLRPNLPLRHEALHVGLENGALYPLSKGLLDMAIAPAKCNCGAQVPGSSAEEV